MPTFRPLAVLVSLALVALTFVAPVDAQAQTGQQLYMQWCQNCHGNPANNKDGVLGGKFPGAIRLAIDVKPEMSAELSRYIASGELSEVVLDKITEYLQTIPGGAIASLAMPAAINFGSVAVGVGSSIASRNIALTAGSNAAVQISTVTSSNPLEFVITANSCNGAFVLPASAGCTVSVQFTPAAAGARSGSINVTSNGIGSPQSFAVSGNGGSAPPPPPPPPPTGSLTVPSSYNFGSLNVGVQGLAQAINITNTSGASVTVSNVTVGPSSDFSLSANLCGTVPNGGSCQVLAAFRPSQAGTRNGTVSIVSSGSGSPQSIALTGTGVGTTPPPPPSGAAKVTVVEYFHAAWGHYFVTAIPGEINALDTGLVQGWARTGLSFQAYASATTGSAVVNRFFSQDPSILPKGSHFYTAIPAEVTILKAGTFWGYEGEVYHTILPTFTVAGATCPSGFVPVYRAFNEGQSGAPNHRFTTSLSVYTDFTTNRGWTGEGPTLCSPL